MRSWNVALLAIAVVGCRGEHVGESKDPLDDAAAEEATTDAADTAAPTDAADTAAPTDAADAAAPTDTADAAAPPDADTTHAEAASDAASCPTSSNNLLRDPSFEEWPSGASLFWKVNSTRGPLERFTDGAPHCASAGRFVSEDGYGVEQYVYLGAPLPPGGKLRLVGKARWIAGSLKAPSLLVQLIDADGNWMSRGSNFASWSADGSWYRHEAVITNDTGRTIAQVEFSFLVNGTPQTLAVDEAELSVVP
jgi:hypothetical protein